MNWVIEKGPFQEIDDFDPIGLIPQNVLDFANKVLDRTDEISYYPAPAWTLDIAVNNDTCWIMEVGSFTSAGLYESDIGLVVQGVEKVVGEYVA